MEVGLSLGNATNEQMNFFWNVNSQTTQHRRADWHVTGDREMLPIMQCPCQPSDLSSFS